MSDEYDDMGRDELLFRLRDWQAIGQDRSDEIHELNAALESTEDSMARLTEVVEQLHEVEAAARDLLHLERYYGTVRDPHDEVLRLTNALHRLDRLRSLDDG